MSTMQTRAGEFRNFVVWTRVLLSRVRRTHTHATSMRFDLSALQRTVRLERVETAVLFQE